MKKELFTGLACLFLLLACSAEEVTPEDQNDDSVKEVQVVTSDVITTPCEFDFNTIQKGDTLNIACSHDLEGANVVIPANVVVNYYEGGKIFNGSLLFEENGKIDGRLLNYQLEVDGKTTLLSTTFLFEKENWNITEGEVSDDVALENKVNIQKAIDDAKKLGGETFEIDELDAYFLVTGEWNEIVSHETSINLPSNFIFEMSNTTTLRVQPNHYKRYVLINLRDIENVTVTGGCLLGDRERHNYNVIKSTHEWGHLINIASGINITIDAVTMKFASGDGLNIHSTRHTFDPLYVGSEKINITNCIFDSNRRNNLSITDGSDIIVNKNTFLNAGIDLDVSKGTAPRFGIDVEAQRAVNADGSLKYYQRAKNITIKNNIEKGGANGAIIVAIGENVIIENNTTEHSISLSAATRCIIRHNKIEYGDRKVSAISVSRSNYEHHVYDNEISSNTIIGHSHGIHLESKDVKVLENTIKDCTIGIAIRDLEKGEVKDNIITNTTKGNYYGINCALASINIVNINKNNINVDYKAINFSDVNVKDEEKSNKVYVFENELNGGEVSNNNSNGIIVN